jgi:hypothetical protein
MAGRPWVYKGLAHGPLAGRLLLHPFSQHLFTRPILSNMQFLAFVTAALLPIVALSAPAHGVTSSTSLVPFPEYCSHSLRIDQAS